MQKKIKQKLCIHFQISYFKNIETRYFDNFLIRSQYENGLKSANQACQLVICCDMTIERSWQQYRSLLRRKWGNEGTQSIN